MKVIFEGIFENILVRNTGKIVKKFSNFASRGNPRGISFRVEKCMREGSMFHPSLTGVLLSKNYTGLH